MKASTLLALTVALLLAIGAAATARMLGLFERSQATAKQDPVIKILVARQNLYAGIAVTSEMVMVRDLRPGELANYNENSKNYLPAQVEAVVLRIPNRNIEADQPILKTDLEDLAFPDGVPGRLAPGTRAVNLSIPKDRAAGGLIAKGDRVDVLMTSRVCDGNDCTKSRILSAFLARNLRVVVKRNQLWTVLRPNPDNQPVSFTLEANPYRAALIEFASSLGTISLLPAAAQRNEKGTSGDVQAASFSMPGSQEYEAEDERVDKLLRGELSITEADLERVFRLRPIVRIPPPPPPPPPVIIQQITGTRPSGEVVFDSKSGERIPRPAPQPPVTAKNESYGPVVAGGVQPMGYTFHMPEPAGSSTSGKADCPT